MSRPNLIPDPTGYVVAQPPHMSVVGSGISPQVTKTPANWGVMQPEVVPRQLLLSHISKVAIYPT